MGQSYLLKLGAPHQHWALGPHNLNPALAVSCIIVLCRVLETFYNVLKAVDWT